MNTPQPAERNERLEWIIALVILVPVLFFGLSALLIIGPALAIVGFVMWGLGTRKPRR